MRLEFIDSALATYQSIKAAYPELAAKIKDCLKDTIEHPSSGAGDPIALDGEYVGLWERRLSLQDSIFYAFNDEKVVVVSIASNARFSERAASKIQLTSFSETDYQSVMDLMAANRGKDTEPKVGIFWYNRTRKELFGVVSHKVSDYTRANASEGRITCSEMHEDVWKRELRKQKYHGDNQGPFIGAYQDKPRGRIFYIPSSDSYEVAVGKWLEDNPEAYDLVIEEFNLPREKTTPKYAIHWDIGMSWR